MKNKAANVRSVLVRSIVTLLFLGCVLFIWHNSMENASVSSARSGKITEMVNEVLERSGWETVTEHFIRKLAHFVEYGMEGVLTVLLFVAYCLRPWKRLWAVVCVGIFTASVDELLQFFSAGRSPGFGDVCIDMAGFISGTLWMLAVCYLMGKALWKKWFQNRNRGKSFSD